MKIPARIIAQGFFEKTSKKLKKGVDKWGWIWYSIKAVRSTRARSKKVEKKMKKVLDNG